MRQWRGRGRAIFVSAHLLFQTTSFVRLPVVSGGLDVGGSSAKAREKTMA